MGLLDEAATGWEDWWHPKTVPTGAAYDPETLGSARAGAIGNIGGNLLALAQGGLSPETRAQLMLGIGKTPLTYQQSMLAGIEGRLHGAQAAQAEEEVASSRAFSGALTDEIKRRSGGGAAAAGGTPVAGGTGAATGGAGGARTAVDAGSIGPYARTALAALKGPESGGNANLQNQYGYSGLYQIGTSLANAAGLYEPAKDEAVADAKGHAVNAWRGTWNIPGFGPMTHQQFLASPDAQQAAGEAAMAHNWRDIQRQGLDSYVGKTIGNLTITPQGLMQAAWLGGVGGLKSWLTGQGDPQDANKTPVSRWAALQPPGGVASDAGVAQPVPAGGGPSGQPGASDGGAGAGGASKLDATDEPRRRVSGLSSLTTDQLTLMRGMTAKEARTYMLQQSAKIEPTRLSPTAVQRYDLDPKASWVWDENGVPKKLQDAPFEPLSAAEIERYKLDPRFVWGKGAGGKPEKLQDAKAEELTVQQKIALGIAPDGIGFRMPDNTIHITSAGKSRMANATELAADHFDPTAIVEIKPDGTRTVHSKGGTRILSPAEIEGRYPPGTVVQLGPDGEKVVSASQVLEQQRNTEQRRQNIFKDTADARKEIESGQVYTQYTLAKPQLSILRQAAPVGTGPADLAMIYAYAKMLDPTSVVRGPESDMIQRTGGTWDTLQGMIKSVKGDGKLSDLVRHQLVDMAESVMHTYERPWQERVSMYRSLAKRQGIEPDDVYPDQPTISHYTPPGQTKAMPQGYEGADGRARFVAGLKAAANQGGAVAKSAAQQLLREHGIDPGELDR